MITSHDYRKRRQFQFDETVRDVAEFLLEGCMQVIEQTLREQHLDGINTGIDIFIDDLIPAEKEPQEIGVISYKDLANHDFIQNQESNLTTLLRAVESTMQKEANDWDLTFYRRETGSGTRNTITFRPHFTARNDVSPDTMKVAWKDTKEKFANNVLDMISSFLSKQKGSVDPCEIPMIPLCTDSLIGDYLLQLSTEEASIVYNDVKNGLKNLNWSLEEIVRAGSQEPLTKIHPECRYYIALKPIDD